MAVDWLSNPTKVANTLEVGSNIFAGAAYLGCIAVGIALPSFGLGTAAAGTLAAACGLSSFVLGIASDKVAQLS